MLRVLGCFAAILVLLPLGIILWVCSVLHSFFSTTQEWLENILENISETVIGFGIVRKYYDARGEIDRLERIIKNPVAYELYWDNDGGDDWYTDIVLAERFLIRKKEDGFSLYYGPALLEYGIESVDDAKDCAQRWIERFCKKTIKTEDRILSGRKWYG